MCVYLGASKLTFWILSFKFSSLFHELHEMSTETEIFVSLFTSDSVGFGCHLPGAVHLWSYESLGISSLGSSDHLCVSVPLQFDCVLWATACAKKSEADLRWPGCLLHWSIQLFPLADLGGRLMAAWLQMGDKAFLLDLWIGHWQQVFHYGQGGHEGSSPALDRGRRQQKHQWMKSWHWAVVAAGLVLYQTENWQSSLMWSEKMAYSLVDHHSSAERIESFTDHLVLPVNFKLLLIYQMYLLLSLSWNFEGPVHIWKSKRI